MDKKGEIIEISSVDSTNNYASELLKSQDLAEGTLIWAKLQTQGRGQKGNSWVSEDGKNLTCSIVISPQFLPIEMQFYLSVVISVSIIELLKSKSENFKIKWPNDIYYNDSKIAGILVENSIIGPRIKNSVIGIGLNINQEFFSEALPNPISLINITGHEHDLKHEAKVLLDIFSRKYEELRTGNFQQLKNGYLDSLYLLGTLARYKDSNGEFTGTIIDVLDSGELVIVDEEGMKRFYMFKEVEFLRKQN